ncbi:hypothetical protein MRB53_034682 [Persea americana]|uniref:Uncharacterized protein n=1 Tax=Persea americana TaxID=3435 RepID=A0ACC2K2I1_PERAE|nr:hypothetical protein MRB53_034682 [Persea americana]
MQHRSTPVRPFVQQQLQWSLGDTQQQRSSGETRSFDQCRRHTEIAVLRRKEWRRETDHGFYFSGDGKDNTIAGNVWDLLLLRQL